MSRHDPLGPFPSSLFQKTTHWFERTRAALLDALPCDRGCYRCCIGLFPVTLLDQQALQQGLRSLPPERRQAILRTAKEQADMISTTAPRLATDPFLDGWPDPTIDQLVTRYHNLPCPALQPDGSCGVYAYRPLTCRSMGIPVESEGSTQGACDVQTSVPLIRISRSLREEEDLLAAAEAAELARLRQETHRPGEELFLPFAFLPSE